MKRKSYLNLDAFALKIGLSPIDKEIVRQKNKIIDYLKTCRIKKKVSQNELAKKLGTKQPAIARMESGYVGEISFDFLVRVALALHVPLSITQSKKAA